MGDITNFKPKDDYSHLVFVKQIDGESVEYVDIDSMTEDQFTKYCRDTGTEWFKRFGITV